MSVETFYTQWGINTSFGKVEETNLTNSKVSHNTLVSLNPYFKADSKWLGAGVGLHIGNNFYALPSSNPKGYGVTDTGLGEYAVLPQAHIRVGPEQFFALEYNFANHFPSALPAFTHEMAIGSGFGARNGFYIKSGATFGSQSHTDLGGYISGYIPFENTVVLEPLIGLGSLSNVYMLGVSYRFGHKETDFKPAQSDH